MSVISSTNSKILFCLLAFFLASCEELVLKDASSTDSKAIFNDTWTILDERYPFFEVKNIDWDIVYETYLPRVTENINAHQLFGVLGDMVMELHDGHTDLSAPASNWSRSYWPITTEYYQRFNIEVIKNYYLNNGYYTKNAVIAGKIHDIGYVFIQNFVDDLSPSMAEEVFNYLEGTQLLIFDMRNNTGGSEIFGDNLICYFLREKTANKIIKLKNGRGHNDFTSFTSYIMPGPKIKEYTRIVVLANKVTFSAGNDFVNNFSILPNVTLLGDTTGGGGSTPFIYELANGWRLRYASNMQLRPTDSLIIDKGIPPDLFIEMQKSETKDNVLDAAIDFLNNY
jgi:hypothetical protein